jgi:tetratricopeptide (TPR) repeat protein
LEAYGQGEGAAEEPGLRLENRISRARLTARLGKSDEAVTLLESAVKEAPVHARAGEAQLELAGVLLEQADYARALTAYQGYLEAFADEAGQAQALLGKGWTLWHLARYAESALVFEKAFAALAEPAQKETALIKAADAYFANAQFKMALEAYQRVLSEFPASDKTAAMLMQVGECHAALKAYEEARDGFARARAQSPDLAMAARAAMRLAALQEEQGQWDDAVVSYNACMQTYTTQTVQAEALFRSAVALYRGGRFGEAEARFEKVQSEFADTSWAEQAYYLRGWALHLLGETRRALQVARQFLQLYPQSPGPRRCCSGWASSSSTRASSRRRRKPSAISLPVSRPARRGMTRSTGRAAPPLRSRNTAGPSAPSTNSSGSTPTARCCRRRVLRRAMR